MKKVSKLEPFKYLGYNFNSHGFITALSSVTSSFTKDLTRMAYLAQTPYAAATILNFYINSKAFHILFCLPWSLLKPIADRLHDIADEILFKSKTLRLKRMQYQRLYPKLRDRGLALPNFKIKQKAFMFTLYTKITSDKQAFSTNHGKWTQTSSSRKMLRTAASKTTSKK